MVVLVVVVETDAWIVRFHIVDMVLSANGMGVVPACV